MKRNASVAAAFLAAMIITAPGVSAEEPVWTKGEVKKVDTEQGKITIKHEEIKNLDMPAMTMVFRPVDPALINEIKEGDSAEFYFVDQNGRMMVQSVKSAK